MLSLDDAIALALENNLDIRVQRFLPWFGEVSLLRTKAGGVLEGVSNAPLLLGSGPSAGFDPDCANADRMGECGQSGRQSVHFGDWHDECLPDW